MKIRILAAAFVLFGLLAGQASASQALNNAPPVGPIILDLDGTAIPHSYVNYSATFIATAAATNLSFAFRDDPAFLSLDNVSVTTGAGPNLATDPGFEAGTIGSNAPAGWTYLNIFGATFSGAVTGGCGNGGKCYYDGAVQAYDSISEVISTVIGALYTVRFSLQESSNQTTFSALSTNGGATGTGGNGINLVVYAGALPTPAPEPGALASFGIGLIGLGSIRRRRKNKCAGA